MQNVSVSSTYRQGGIPVATRPSRNRGNSDIPDPVLFFSRADFRHDSRLAAEVARRSNDNDDLTDDQEGVESICAVCGDVSSRVAGPTSIVVISGTY